MRLRIQLLKVCPVWSAPLNSQKRNSQSNQSTLTDHGQCQSIIKPVNAFHFFAVPNPQQTHMTFRSKSTKFLIKLFPILGWLPKYFQLDWKRKLIKDISAGFSCGITVIPQGMAYAIVVGLAPIYGLYCAFVPPLLYFIFGSSPQLIVGPTAVM